MTREHKPDTIIFVRKAINILKDSRRTSAINESLTEAKYICFRTFALLCRYSFFLFYSIQRRVIYAAELFQ